MIDLSTVPPCQCPKRFHGATVCGKAKKLRGYCSCKCHAHECREAFIAAQPKPEPKVYDSGPLSRGCKQPGCGAKAGEFCKTDDRRPHAIRLLENPTTEQLRRITAAMSGVRTRARLRRHAA